MFLQIGNDAIALAHITAIRFSQDGRSVKLWTDAPVGPRFYWWFGADYEAFTGWWLYKAEVFVGSINRTEEE